MVDDSPLARFGISIPPAADMGGWHLPFPLRQFQQEAVDKILEQRRGTIEVATGSGKTGVAIALELKLRLPMVILVPTKALIDQNWLPKLREAGIHAGVYYGEEKRPGFVTISTYQTLVREPTAIRSFPIVVFDEGDLSVGPTWVRILEEAQSHPYAVVLTATLPDDVERKAQLLENFPVLVRRTPREQIEAGHFVPVEVIPKYVQLGPAARRAYDEVTQRLRSLRYRLGTGNIGQVRRYLAGAAGSEMAKYAAAYLRNLQERTSLLTNVPERAPVLLSIAQAHPGERMILFGTRVEPLAEMAAYLTMNGYPTRMISAETTRGDRRSIFQHWRPGDIPIIASVDVITRGIDVPEASVAVLIGGGAGARRLIQRVGRIVRPAPGKSVATAYILAAQGTNEERLVQAARRIFSGGKFIEDAAEEEGAD